MLRLRTATRVGAFTLAVLAAEAAHLAATYKTPCTPVGPTSGVCVERRQLVPAGDGLAGRMFSRSFLSRTGEARAPPSPSEVEGALRVFVLGDSLASGVGGDVGASPPLARGCVAERPFTLRTDLRCADLAPRTSWTDSSSSSFAAALAQLSGSAVSWTSLGRTGANLSALREHVLPQLRRAVDKLKSEGSDGRVHVLVLMCGLNDFKVPRSTPGVFGADLEALLREIRDITGPTTLFILPGLPLEATLAFPTPLHHLACAVGSLWDEQKRALASAAGRVVFVPPPPLSTVGGAVRSLLSEDLVHPNAAGYTLWGQHLAQAAWSSRH